MAQNPSLASLTDIHEFINWNNICDRRDVSIKEGCFEPWMVLISDYMRNNYSPECFKRLKRNLKKINLRHNLTLNKLIDGIIPSTQTIQKGDLAEAVCSLTFEGLFGLVIPYLKWANKSHPEMPEHGIDILAFYFGVDPSDDTMYAADVKWRKDTTSLIEIINRKKGGVISTLNNFVGLKLGYELCFLLKKIENKEKISKYRERIMDFLIRFTDQPKKILNAAFFLTDSSVDIDKCVEALKPVAHKPRKLLSYNHLVDNLDTVTGEVFRRVST